MDQIRTAFSAEKSGCTDAVNVSMRQLVRSVLRQLSIDWGRGKSRVMSFELGQPKNKNIGPNFGIVTASPSHATARLIAGETLDVGGDDRIIN